MKRKILFLLFFIGILLSSCTQEKVYEIKVVRVVDDRYDHISEEQFNYILNNNKEVMKECFDIEIEYIDMGEKKMEEFFADQSKRLPDSEIKDMEKDRYNIFSGDIAKFKPDILKHLKRYKLNTLKGFLSEEEREGIENYEQMADRVMEMYGKKLDSLKNAKAEDKVVLEPDRADLYSSTQWIAITRNLTRYDAILTNIPLIDDTLFNPCIHTLVRGGITCGFVNSSKTGSRYKESIYFTLFPFVSDNDFLISERDKDYPQTSEEQSEIIAYQLCHELGHFILKYDEAYNHSNCIMNPPNGLKYKKWYDEITKAGKCTKKHRRYKLK
jgi:hypothetical protein